MFLTIFSFVVSRLKMHQAVHLNIQKLWRDSSQKEKFIKSLLGSVFLMF